MISKPDLVLTLSQLEREGNEEAHKYLLSLYKKDTDMISIVKYVNSVRPIEISKFYEKLRKSYNEKHSDLYINIVKEVDDVDSVLTTLSSYVLQALIFSKKIEDKETFFKNSRLSEATEVLNNYFLTYDLTGCVKVLSLIKADIKLFEYIKNSTDR